MDEQQFPDFLAALGEEFCHALRPTVGWDRMTPQDGYEVFLRAFNHSPSPRLLASLTASQIEQLRVACESYFAVTTISGQQVHDAIARTLQRWPPDVN